MCIRSIFNALAVQIIDAVVIMFRAHHLTAGSGVARKSVTSDRLKWKMYTNLKFR